MRVGQIRGSHDDRIDAVPATGEAGDAGPAPIPSRPLLVLFIIFTLIVSSSVFVLVRDKLPDVDAPAGEWWLETDPRPPEPGVWLITVAAADPAFAPPALRLSLTGPGNGTIEARLADGMTGDDGTGVVWWWAEPSDAVVDAEPGSGPDETRRFLVGVQDVDGDGLLGAGDRFLVKFDDRDADGAADRFPSGNYRFMVRHDGTDALLGSVSKRS